MSRHDFGPNFPLGRVVLLQGARQAISASEMLNALLIHMRRGSPESLRGCRRLSVRCTDTELPFWIITEADGTTTTVLLPEEFPLIRKSLKSQHNFPDWQRFG